MKELDFAEEDDDDLPEIEIDEPCEEDDDDDAIEEEVVTPMVCFHQQGTGTVQIMR